MRGTGFEGAGQMSFAAISLANRPLTENRLNKHKQQAQQALSAVSQAYKGLEERQFLLAIGIHFHFHSVVTTPSSPKTSPEQSSSSLIPRCSSSPSPSSQALPRPMSLREPLAPHQCARESPSPATTPSSSTPPSTAPTTWPSPMPPPPTHTRSPRARPSPPPAAAQPGAAPAPGTTRTTPSTPTRSSVRTSTSSMSRSASARLAARLPSASPATALTSPRRRTSSAPLSLSATPRPRRLATRATGRFERGVRRLNWLFGRRLCTLSDGVIVMGGA
ncbi:hypothetical protein BDY17DRAFT_347567 [Neohortaea acidophila]|uniref:Uncharacterized protein n=1 Tax=Neohortaea acidophila TaxID=245834 RepID=A0A6A6PND5_9PEZI|nr:uncharacterized protein BDY17DRAFT_347567 [Neohortaea acidophila]KAF2481144.1 hypothetical protein BDY17DRAFT_347567 [Neohortaea acidophila]